MSNEIEQRPDRGLVPHSGNPLDAPTQEFSQALDRRGQNRKALMQWIREALVEGVDFGRIHVVSKNKCPDGNRCTNPNHFSKPSLFKPGAEKICGMLGVWPVYPNMDDYEQMAMRGEETRSIILRCHIVDAAGNVVAEGVGCRNLDQDYGDLNKAFKMAEKSGHIDATLRCAGLSELFTQDIEDMRQKVEADQGSPAQKTGGGDRITFGKHGPKNGKPGALWSEIPSGYLEWLMDKGRNEADREKARAELERRKQPEGETRQDEPEMADEAAIRGMRNALKEADIGVEEALEILKLPSLGDLRKDQVAAFHEWVKDPGTLPEALRS